MVGTELTPSEYFDLFLEGLTNTLQVFAGALVLATVIGVALGSLRAVKWAPVRWVATALVEVFRGTSVIIQVFWIYYALPLFTPIQLTPLVAAWIAIGLTEGGYIAEVVRGAFKAVQRSQFESSIAINHSPWSRWKRIMLPQAIPIMLPSYGNHVVSTLKETAVVSLIMIADLTYVAESVRSRTSDSGVVFLALAIIYLALALVLTAGMRWLERKAWIGAPLPRRSFQLKALKRMAVGK